MIGSISSSDKQTWQFSVLVHLGSNPALIIEVSSSTRGLEDTYDNILQTECYTINRVHTSFIANAIIHQQNSKQESEFEKCKLSEEYDISLKSTFVKESRKISYEVRRDDTNEVNKCMMIIGSIQKFIDDKAVEDDR